MSEVGLLTSLLAAEHAAVYAYGVLGARLAPPERSQALADRDAHRVSRDVLTALLTARQAAAPGTLPAYAVAPATADDARGLAARVEAGLASRWLDLVAGTDDRDLRRTGVAGLSDCAVRAAQWQRALGAVPGTTALPGVTRPG